MLKSICAGLLSLSTSVFAEIGVTDTEIVIGAQAPLTGAYAVYAEHTKGSKAYFEKINAEGGIHGRKIKLIVDDDGTNPTQALAAVRKQVEKDNVFVIYTGTGFEHTATLRYLKQKQIPDLFIIEGSNPLDEYNLAFRGAPDFRTDGKTMGEYIANNFAGKKIGYLYENSRIGADTLPPLEKALEGKAKITAKESFELGAADADSQVANLMKAGVDVVVAQGSAPVFASAAKSAKQKGWSPKWVVGFPTCLPETIMLGGDAVEGTISSSFHPIATDDSPAIAEHKKILEKYQPGAKVSTLTIWGQIDAESFVEALRRAGKNLTRKSIVDAVESLNGYKCSLCLNPIEYSKTSRQMFTKLKMKQVKQGKWVDL